MYVFYTWLICNLNPNSIVEMKVYCVCMYYIKIIFTASISYGAKYFFVLLSMLVTVYILLSSQKFDREKQIEILLKVILFI